MCPDLDHTQSSTVGFLAEMILVSTKIKWIKIQKCLQWMSMERLESHEQFVCTNHDFVHVHKSEVDPQPEFDGTNCTFITH